ncbi:hypothetical protein U9R90_28710 [Streptomyces sp. E11-3]|uniref:hypothetical protein n=1 Tax=Streptomyces sp. E11-3 TaxID=3110112 RepID=UPI00397F640C
MTDVERTTTTVSAPWQRRPRWLVPATLCWAVTFGGFGLACALTGTPLFYQGDDPIPAGAAWLLVAVAAMAAGATLAVARSGPRPALRALLWVACALSAVCAFALLMDVITLVFGQEVDSVVAATNHVLGALGAVLLAAIARSDRPIGDAPDATVGSDPVPAPRRVRLTAYAGAAAFLPYAAMKTVWALGGTFAGLSGEQMRAISEHNGATELWLTLESWGLDPTALLAALGVFLLFGLVRPWGQVFPRWTLVLHGRRVPRWLPLTPALIGAATLAPYGAVGVSYAALGTAGLVDIPAGDFPSPADALLVSWIGLGGFAVYGAALLVAARSYWLRTRPSAAVRRG